MPEQYTAAQINKHLKSGLKQALLYIGAGRTFRIMKAREVTRRKLLEVQIMGHEHFIDKGWTAVGGRRIDLL